jgi:hypothetical protein
MFEGVNSVASRVHTTSHLFSYKMDSLKMLGQQNFFTFLNFGQAFGSNGLQTGVEVPLLTRFRGAYLGGYFIDVDMSSPTGLTRGHLGFSKSKKPASSNATTSI